MMMMIKDEILPTSSLYPVDLLFLLFFLRFVHNISCIILAYCAVCVCWFIYYNCYMQFYAHFSINFFRKQNRRFLFIEFPIFSGFVWRCIACFCVLKFSILYIFSCLLNLIVVRGSCCKCFLSFFYFGCLRRLTIY